VSTLAEVVAATVGALRAAGVPAPETDARWLVEAVSGVDPRRSPDHTLADDEGRRLGGLVARRCAREPLQLVLGTTAFRTIELRCRPGVFIPRPETEILAGIVIDLVREARSRGRSPVVVHEPCCGTGAVGLAVASEVDGVVMRIADHSVAAVELAIENRDRLVELGALRSTVEIHRGDLLGAFSEGPHGPPDVIVANPPYLPSADLAGLEPEVADHDPHDALAGGADGHEVVDVLLAESVAALVPGGAVVLEIDARRAGDALDVARRVGLVGATIRDDLAGAARFVLARRPG